MSARVSLSAGGLGEAVRLEGDVLHLVLGRALAPGAPITLRAELEGGPMQLGGKIVGSKKRADERFDVRVRLVGLRRRDRARLLALDGP